MQQPVIKQDLQSRIFAVVEQAGESRKILRQASESVYINRVKLIILFLLLVSGTANAQLMPLRFTYETNVRHRDEMIRQICLHGLYEPVEIPEKLQGVRKVLISSSDGPDLQRTSDEPFSGLNAPDMQQTLGEPWYFKELSYSRTGLADTVRNWDSSKHGISFRMDVYFYDSDGKMLERCCYRGDIKAFYTRPVPAELSLTSKVVCCYESGQLRSQISLDIVDDRADTVKSIQFGYQNGAIVSISTRRFKDGDLERRGDRKDLLIVYDRGGAIMKVSKTWDAVDGTATRSFIEVKYKEGAVLTQNYFDSNDEEHSAEFAAGGELTLHKELKLNGAGQVLMETVSVGEPPGSARLNWNNTTYAYADSLIEERSTYYQNLPEQALELSNRKTVRFDKVGRVVSATRYFYNHTFHQVNYRYE